MGPALCSDLPVQRGLDIVSISPCDSKMDRLRKCLPVIRKRLVWLPERAAWLEGFLVELTTFPYCESDQVDALSQFLNWIAENPTPQVRPPQALMAGCNSQGHNLAGASLHADMQMNGMAVYLNSRSARRQSG